MKVKQQHFLNKEWDTTYCDEEFSNQSCNLVLAFGASELIVNPEADIYLKSSYPNAEIIFCSTSGEIIGDEVFDNSIVVTAVDFKKTTIKCVSLNINSVGDSYKTGAQLMEELNMENLVSVLIISDGTVVNGSELVEGMNSKNIHNVPLTGGLAGDAAAFVKTYTGLNNIPTEGNVIAVGFYGKNLLVGHGSLGGWDEFGHERSITKSAKNVLYEIDGRSALSLYKEYLGDYVNDLPYSALLFPLSLKMEGANSAIVRTILSVNEANNSMTFAGNMPEGSKVRLMKANFDRLISGSSGAAQSSFHKLGTSKPQLAILISCVGRKLILQQRVSEEVEAAREVFGIDIPISGFYSYGEISPYKQTTNCELHNQTMTIITLSEI